MPRKQIDYDAIFDTFASQLVKTAEQPNITRYIPMPEQDLFHQSLAKYRLLKGGNRGGKTFGSIADDVLVLTRRHPYRNHLYADRPRRGRFIGVDFDRGVAQIALPLFAQLVPPSDLIDGSWERSYRPSTRMLTLADGSTCSFMSYEQDPNKFQGVSLDFFHCDEEPPEAIWRESLLRILDTGGSATISMTPVEQMEWIQDEIVEPFEDGVLANWDVINLDTRRNIHLPVKELQELEQGMSESEKIIRLTGGYDNATNMVFPEFSRKYPNVIPQEAFNPKQRDDWRFYRSMDHGYANPTAWCWTAVHYDGTIVTFEVLYQAGVNVETWAKLVLEKDREIGMKFWGDSDWHPDACVGDPAIIQRNQAVGNVPSIQQAYAQAGVNIFVGGIVKTRTGSQNFGLDKYHQYLRQRPIRHGVSAVTGELGEPWWQITANCTPLIDEMRKARRPKMSLKAKDEKNTSEEIRDKDNHAIDAVKYLWMATHELRPAHMLDEEDNSDFRQSFLKNFGQASSAPTTHADVREASLAHRRQRQNNGYSALEE
jgi:phage terminase large subunit-like protein